MGFFQKIGGLVVDSPLWMAILGAGGSGRPVRKRGRQGVRGSEEGLRAPGEGKLRADPGTPSDNSKKAVAVAAADRLNFAGPRPGMKISRDCSASVVLRAFVC